MTQTSQFLFGRFRLAPDNARLWHEAQVIPLPPKAFATLRYLAEHPHPDRRRQTKFCIGPRIDCRSTKSARAQHFRCGGTLKIVAAIETPSVIAKILAHLGLWPLAADAWSEGPTIFPNFGPRSRVFDSSSVQQ